jgi:hypothetical protein
MRDELDIHLKVRGQDPARPSHPHAPGLGVRARQRHYAERAGALRPALPMSLRRLGAVGRVVPPPPTGSPQAVVKTTVSTGGNTGWFVGTYLQKGKGQAGSDAPLFGPAVAQLPQWVRATKQDPHQFRIIISHAPHPTLDRTQWIALLMAQVERDFQGRPLDWVAAHHDDRPNPHTHIVVRGRDRQGKDLYMTPHYFQHGMRYRASQFLSWLIGWSQTQQHHLQSNRQQADGLLRGSDDPDTRSRLARTQDLGQSLWQRLQAGTPWQASSTIDALARQLDTYRRTQEQLRQQVQQRGGWGHGR